MYFKVFPPYFELLSPLSAVKNVPMLGNEDSSRQYVEQFYQFWTNFQLRKNFRQFIKPFYTIMNLQVFNIFFVKEHEKKHVVHCLRCARELNKDLTGWICLGKLNFIQIDLSIWPSPVSKSHSSTWNIFISNSNPTLCTENTSLKHNIIFMFD